ncbi:hypothetical protein SLEP1_g25934 [Rubroshorea leprosula]|uniref:Uncharacterized protein n=1 Tax=Rubroshorea leprosula TaxID=152421 RepID=A0AAV5JNH9_9ROSI|nr:hypothetical protein SLEP1_g25934 [Rubroshorea leprosula]
MEILSSQKRMLEHMMKVASSMNISLLILKNNLKNTH